MNPPDKPIEKPPDTPYSRLDLELGSESQSQSDPHALAILPAPDWAALALEGEGIVLLDARQRVTAANARALECLHCPLIKLAGRNFWQALPPAGAQHQSAAHHTLKGAPRHVFVLHHQPEDRWIEYTVRRHAAGFVVNLRDVDAAHKLQHLLDESKRYNRLIFEANPNAMWVFDLDSQRIFSVNQAAVSFYGIPRKVFMSLKMQALFPQGEGAELLALLQPGGMDELAAPELRLCRQRKMNGQEVLVELAWSAVDWDGHRGVLLSLADISQRHLADSALRRANVALEQALRQQQAELKKSREDLLAFTQAVSSDLQDSLHVAHGFAARLGEKYAAALDESGRHYVRRIQASISQLARLVDDLRTLAQLPLRAGVPERVDLAPLCQTLVAALRQRSPQREVTVEIAASLPLLADRGLLATALECLLENAWKFTSKKAEAWIKIELLADKVPGDKVPADKSAGELVLRIADNGTGFDSDYSARLFTPFQRLHSSADFPGNGLGLAIVKRAAELQGGRVWAESGPGGASFFMALPHPRAEARQDQQPNSRIAE